jgi:hypothetical protein
MAFDYSGIPPYEAMQLRLISQRVKELLPDGTAVEFGGERQTGVYAPSWVASPARPYLSCCRRRSPCFRNTRI